MDGGKRRWRRGLGLLALVVGWTSCSPTGEVDALPGVGATLAGVGKRLSRSLPSGELTRLAASEERVLAALLGGERDALGRGYLRFGIDRGADVWVAAPRMTPPFWLADQGFKQEEKTVDREGMAWCFYRKRFAAGRVGLGVNGLDRRPAAHYAVFVCAIDGKEARPTAVEGDGCEVLRAGEGASVFPVLPEALRGAWMIKFAHDRRHAAMLARGRVWKTHVVSSEKPDQVTIAYGEDTGRELAWSWRTSAGVKDTRLSLRKGKGEARVYSGESELVALPNLLNDPVMRRHTVLVSGLEPGMAYEYAIDGGGEWESVRTAPGAVADVSMLYMGDPQCGLEGWGKLLAEAHRRRPDASALLIAGDLVDRGNERSNWDHFFLRAEGVFERLPVMPAVGNHEYLDRGPWLYRAFFALPGNGPRGLDADLVYSFELGDAFIAVLDSTLAVTDPGQARLQAEWLEERLGSTRRTWKIVMFHHPLYASHTTRESPGLRDAWVPVFDRNHVDLVLQGHDHAYLRTYPMRGGKRVDSASEGTVYVVSVSGDKYCEQGARDYIEVGFTNVSTYQTIDIKASDGRLVYKSLDILGSERDGFVIEKGARTGRLAREKRDLGLEKASDFPKK